MFTCENCKATVPSRQPVNRVVTEHREKVYRWQVKRGRRIEDREGFGSEIVKEINVCPKCYLELTGEQPKLVTEIKRPTSRVRGFNTRPARSKKWRNPKQKREHTTSSQKSSPHRTQGRAAKSSSSTTGPARKKPIVEKASRPRPA